ncbi:MAG: LPS export ABC transporter periplasmic protein LptC [Candidatus Cloacimonetes bacterium]|nr:LPS export ABC transporter periplasmic protein LptC [Candidatus Cloacimonadota bacterium]
MVKHQNLIKAAISLVVLVPCLDYTAKVFYPIQSILLKNKIYSYFGLSEEIKLPNKSDKDKKKTNAFGFPTIKKFNIVGFNESKISYEIRGDQLAFQDKKIFMFYSPLIKEVRLNNPKIVFNSIKEKPITCTSTKGVFDQKKVVLNMKDNVVCTQNKKKLPIKKLSFDGKLKKLTLFIKDIKVELI